MPDNTQAGIHSARPILAVAGEDDAALAAALQRLEIIESIEGLHRCEATFANWGPRNGSAGFLYFDRDKLEFGRGFQVKLGTDSLFEGRIMALEAAFLDGGPPEITILAEDRFQDLRMSRRTRTFQDVTDSDVFHRVASDHGLQAAVQVDGPTHRLLAQVNQSDLAFLRERARGIGAELWTEGSTLHAESRARRGGTTLQLTHGHQLRRFTVVADLATQRTRVSAHGWSVASKEALTHAADDSLVSNELNGGTSGPSILKSALGERRESIAHTVPFDADEARIAAESHFKQCARRFVVGHGVAETQPGLRVGALVDLRNLGPLFNGKYYVSGIRHRFDGTLGLRTEFSAERAGLGSS